MMKPQERRERIFEKFEKLYVRKKEGQDTSSPRRYPIWYGFECGDGWLALIEDLSCSIQHHVDIKQKVDSAYAQPEVLQVKEKFGGLRFYVSNEDEFISGLIYMAEKISYRTCESCGNPGTLSKTGWWKTLCDLCRSARNNKDVDEFARMSNISLTLSKESEGTNE